MNRYLIFAGPNYYPRGGAEDLKDDRADLDAAKEYADHCVTPRVAFSGYGEYDWAHVYDTQTQEIVYDNYRGKKNA